MLEHDLWSIEKFDISPPPEKGVFSAWGGGVKVPINSDKSKYKKMTPQPTTPP